MVYNSKKVENRRAKLNRDLIYNIFSRIPKLRTERLLLRRIKSSDLDDMFEYASDPRTTAYLLWEPHADLAATKKSLERINDGYRKGNFYDWALVENTNGKMIGTCGFTALDIYNNCAEIGYVLNPAYWGKGYAPEAVARVIHFGFNVLKLNRIEARYMVENSRSRRVMEKCGMKFEGVNRSSMFVKGAYRDIGVCSILSNEYGTGGQYIRR